MFYLNMIGITDTLLITGNDLSSFQIKFLYVVNLVILIFFCNQICWHILASMVLCQSRVVQQHDMIVGVNLFMFIAKCFRLEKCYSVAPIILYILLFHLKNTIISILLWIIRFHVVKPLKWLRIICNWSHGRQKFSTIAPHYCYVSQIGLWPSYKNKETFFLHSKHNFHHSFLLTNGGNESIEWSQCITCY